jgi:hypothetical protein
VKLFALPGNQAAAASVIGYLTSAKPSCGLRHRDLL